MSDIFDELKDLENADLDAGDLGVDASEDSNFNESELQDIMAEIDNLEKDFAAEPQVTPVIAKKETIAPAEKISKESEEFDESPEDMMAEIEEAVEAKTIIAKPIVEEIPETKVLSFEKKSPPVASIMNDAHSNVSLAASGDMSLNLSFKIGDEEANLVIDKEKGLHVIFSGVELTLHATNGCTVQMANGVSLNVPVKGTDSANKKAM